MISRCVPRPHGIFHPVAAVLILLLESVFLGEVLSSQFEEPQKKSVHLYRSPRRNIYIYIV